MAQNFILARNIIIVIGIALVAVQCKREDMLLFSDSNTPPPATVSDLKVNNQPGGAIITYKLPNDERLLYVKAVYELQPGQKAETKTTYYSDTLKVEGFGDTSVHDIQIISVGKNGKESSPQTIAIRPLTPRVLKTFQSLKLAETFGGAVVKFHNDANANLALVLLADSTGRNDWYTVNTFFTKADSGNFSARGFPPSPKNFAVYVRDRWNNKSDTILRNLIPLEESLLPKPFTEIRLPTDNWQGHTFSSVLHPMPMLWDNIVNNSANCFHTVPGSGVPSWFTFDLKNKFILSRFKLYHRGGSGLYYANADIKTFEIWGSNNPNSDGTWASWDSIATFNSYKPSGLPLGQVNTDDNQFAVVNGEDFDMPLGISGYRYLRFKIVQVWGAVQMMYISELTFWGKQIQ